VGRGQTEPCELGREGAQLRAVDVGRPELACRSHLLGEERAFLPAPRARVENALALARSEREPHDLRSLFLDHERAFGVAG